MSHHVKTVETKPFNDQKAGTSGLRKKVSVYQQTNYVENFLQSYFDALRNPGGKHEPLDLATCSLFVGGDGRYWMRDCIQKVVQIAAANGVSRLFIALNGICSTPAASYIIRSMGLSGGIILTASHNPGGPQADFGIKFNQSNGGPALEWLTNRVFSLSNSIKTYQICDQLQVDLSKLGTQTFGVCEGDKCHIFRVEVIEVIKPYADFMEKLFDFQAIKGLISSGFRVTANALHGVMGPFVEEILVRRLGMNEKDAVNCNNLEDFGGLHPDPNLTYAAELVRLLEKGEHDLGVAFDGDGDRNMIIGKNGFFVTPCDSLAVLAANLECIPYFQQTGVKGFARSMPTSCAVDRVAAKLGKDCYETPTGWKFFGNLMDAGKISLCGEESFGTGSDHIREKDGIWTCLAWLSVLAHRKQSVEAIVKEHWKAFGRNFFTRYDYENCDSDSAKAMMEHLETLCQLGSLNNKPFSKAGRNYVVRNMDNFSYVDPIDGSLTEKQGIRVLFNDGSRLIFRLSGTGSSGATIRMYMECCDSGAEQVLANSAEKLRPLVEIALEISQLACFINRTEPTVIT